MCSLVGPNKIEQIFTGSISSSLARCRGKGMAAPCASPTVDMRGCGPRCDPQHLHVAPPRYAHKGVTLLQPLRGGPGPTRRPRGNRRAEARVARLPGQCSCPSDAMHRPTWPEHAPQRRPPRAATHCTAGRGAINPRHQPTEPYHKRQYSSIHELTSATVW
jgi:hypothetical protein